MDDHPVGDGTTTLSDPPPRSLSFYGPLRRVIPLATYRSRRLVEDLLRLRHEGRANGEPVAIAQDRN
jgi:hypothetical protein